MRKRPNSPGRLPTADVAASVYSSSMHDKLGNSKPQARRGKIGRLLLALNIVALVVFYVRSSSASSSSSSSQNVRPLTLNTDGSVAVGDLSLAVDHSSPSQLSASWRGREGIGALGRRLGIGGGAMSSPFSSSMFSSLSSSSSSPPTLSESERLEQDRAELDAAAARLGLSLESPVVQLALEEAKKTPKTTTSLALSMTKATRRFASLDLDEQVEARALEIKARPLSTGRGHDASRDRRGYFLSYVETDPLYPFQRIRFGNGSDSGVVAVIAPFYDLNYFRSETQRALFWRLKAQGHVVIGVSSYQEFPGNISNPHDDRHVIPRDYALLHHVDGWLHCFRAERAERVIPRGVPRMLLSESDFTDPERRDGGGSLVPWGAPEVNKTWDLVYSDQGGDWNDYARNWPLAIDSIVKLASERNASTLVMGRDPSEEPRLKPWVDAGLVGFQPPKTPWRDFLKKIESSRVLFAPNGHDASPRVVAEALCLDVAVLVNANIDGGWKYAEHEETGATFTSADDVVAAFDKIVANEKSGRLTPRKWFMENSGIKNSAVRLEAFLELAVGEERLAKAAAVGAKVTQ